MVYADIFLYNNMDVDVHMGGRLDMNTICLGCGDEMFANVLICEVCWRGD